MTLKKKFAHVDEASIPIPPADVSHISRKWLDLPYASLSPTQKLDIYLPDKGDGPFPVILHIHGGAFEIGDKGDIQVQPYFKALPHGYAVVSVNYRLSGEAIFPAGLPSSLTESNGDLNRGTSTAMDSPLPFASQ